MVFRRLRGALTASSLVTLLLAGALLAFGLRNIHAVSRITEGGVLGLVLLLNVHFGWSPAATGLILNGLSYALGWRALGGRFLVRSGVAALSFSLSYRLFERFPPLIPDLAAHPLAAAVAGAVFVGVGAGLCVRAGGAPSGDDALAMSVTRLTGLGIEWAYLISDLTVLGLSLTYIPVKKIVYSLITVVLSGQLIGWIQRLPGAGKDKNVN